MATHSSPLAWRIPWVEEPGRLQSMGSQRVGHDWVTSLTYLKERRDKTKRWFSRYLLDSTLGDGGGVGAWRRGVGGQVRILQSKKKREKVNGRERSLGAVHEERWVCVAERHCPDFPLQSGNQQTASEYQSLGVCLGHREPYLRGSLSEGQLASCDWQTSVTEAYPFLLTDGQL